MINLCQVMKMDIRESFEIYFELVEDPRSQAHITYKLSDILFMLVTGMLCSCTDLEMIIEFAEEKLDFLKKYTELEEIPCLSTLSNILKVINPEEVEKKRYGNRKPTIGKMTIIAPDEDFPYLASDREVNKLHCQIFGHQEIDEKYLINVLKTKPN